MDYNYYSLRWLAAIALCCTVVQGQSSCDLDTAAFVDTEIFRVVTFEVEEGIPLQPRKLIGTISLSGNSSIGYKFDEPYFRKPNNFKTNARPAHFDIVFINISTVQDETTVQPPTQDSTFARTTQFFASTPKAAQSFNDTSSVSSGSDMLPSNESAKLIFLENKNNDLAVTAFLANVTPHATTSMSSTEEPRKCGAAQVFQIYDLDREESDTHYLAISNYEEDWGIPLLVVIKVTDINDNSPVFVPESLHTLIKNDVSQGDIVAHIQATDADVGINADLRYSIDYASEKRGNASESNGSMTFLIHEKFGIVTLFGDITDLEPPTKITFKVIVKDHGDIYVANRATASATISIVERTWAPTVGPATSKSIAVSGGVIAGCVLSGVFLLGMITFAAFRWNRRRNIQQDAQLQFMMDDDNLITA